MDQNMQNLTERTKQAVAHYWHDSLMTPTIHRLIHGDARDLTFLKDESVHLVVTSPPYWNLKRYNENPDQLEKERFMVREDEGLYHVRPAKKRLSEIGG